MKDNSQNMLASHPLDDSPSDGQGLSGAAGQALRAKANYDLRPDEIAAIAKERKFIPDRFFRSFVTGRIHPRLTFFARALTDAFC